MRPLPAPSIPTIEGLSHRWVLLNLETGPDGQVHKIGALREGRVFSRKGRFEPGPAFEALDTFADGAEFIVGHNILAHDLPIVRKHAPESRAASSAVGPGPRSATGGA